MRTNARGHCYFELIEKEDEKIVARMRANIWAYTYRGLSAWFESQSGQSLKNGLKVLCQVNVNFHELYGLSLNVREIDPRFTLGERARKRKEIIDRLNQEGVFDNPFADYAGFTEMTEQRAVLAMRVTYFHWGFHGWAVYVMIGLCLAYFGFRKKLPLTLRSALYPVIGDRIYGPIGHAVDLLAVFGTVFGLFWP